MAKRIQQESGEERVTAKSRPMMNLTVRSPLVVSSSASSNPVRTSYGYQDPGKSVAGDDRKGKPKRPSPPGYSKEDYGQSWSSQEWKSGVAAHDRSGKPEKTSWDMMQQVALHREEPLLDGNAHSVRYGEMIHDGSGKLDSANFQEEADSEIFVMGSDAAEFVNKVKDQVLVNDQEEIHGLDKIHWEKNSWRRLSLLGDEKVFKSSAHKSLSSQILCCASGGSFNIQIPTKLGRTDLQGQGREKLQRL